MCHEEHSRIIFELMSKIQKKLQKYIREYFEGSELTLPQMSILLFLLEQGPMNISEISAEMGLTKSTTSGIIDRLERDGLVARNRSTSDRRVVTVELTEKVDELTLQIEQKFKDFFGHLFCKSSTAEMLTIITGLEKFNQILES